MLRKSPYHEGSWSDFLKEYSCLQGCWGLFWKFKTWESGFRSQGSRAMEFRISGLGFRIPLQVQSTIDTYSDPP